MKKAMEYKKVSRSVSNSLSLIRGLFGLCVLILLYIKIYLPVSHQTLLWIKGFIGFSMTVMFVLSIYLLWRYKAKN